ncbi:uncharacterized protein [Populus alba]|uniref:Uncharacterized protein n=1 Tax=Populus alba TaxID=43335 RepID=A0A4U5QTR5_POPAL|nr:uncharacterized protein LOC118041552 [Populus alba]TKS14450.1 hypothetical protein D5086_0000045240 [Populus alba]
MINSEESKSVASDFELGFGGRAFAAAGAAVLSAVIVNPLDVAKTRSQAKAAGVPYQGLSSGTACFESNTMFPDVKSTIGACREHHLWDIFAGTIRCKPCLPVYFKSELSGPIIFVLFPLSIPADWNAPRLPSILALNFHGSNYIIQSAWTII